MLFTDSQICRLIDETWGSLIGQTLSRTTEPPSLAEGSYSCSIEFGSGWSGRLSLDLSRPLAQELAGRMFGREADELQPADVANAVGELTSMLAGAINGLLSQPAQLSLPAVTEDLDHVDYRLRHANCVVLHDLVFDCGGETLRVSLVRRTAARVGSIAEEPGDRSAATSVPAAPAVASTEYQAPTTGVPACSAGRASTASRAEDILAEARAEADQILVRARAEARRLRAASLESEASPDVSDAEALREDARRYALEVLGNLESYTTQVLDSVRKSRDWLKTQ
jgi:vacuolar-type H+-ATPase subunit H